MRAYRWMIDRGATRVIVAGDWSGCSLVLSFLLSLRQQDLRQQDLRQQDLPMPGGAVLLCPWIDLLATGRDRPPHELDDIRDATAGLYLAGHPADDPLLSPLSADLSGLPPMLIQAATGDPLLDEARQLADHAAECGVDARFELFSVDTHDFHIFWSFLPEAAQALRQAGQFARDRLSLAGGEGGRDLVSQQRHVQRGP